MSKRWDCPKDMHPPQGEFVISYNQERVVFMANLRIRKQLNQRIITFDVNTFLKTRLLTLGSWLLDCACGAPQACDLTPAPKRLFRSRTLCVSLPFPVSGLQVNGAFVRDDVGAA